MGIIGTTVPFEALESGETAGQRAPTSSRAGADTSTFVLLVYVCVFAIAVLNLPARRLDDATTVFVVSIGLLALWRYSWWGWHVIRALRYRRTRFPAYRQAADAISELERPEHVYVLITSYRIAPETSFKVHDALVKNAIDYGAPTTIIASVTDQTDVDVLGHVLAENGEPHNIRIRYMFQRGDGKRSAMADVLRFIAREMPAILDQPPPGGAVADAFAGPSGRCRAPFGARSHARRGAGPAHRPGAPARAQPALRACDCMLFWAAPAGDWVKKGDRLFTLVGTGPSDLLVEALVPLRAVSKIRLHDMAFIELPHTGELIEARVALIALEAERHSRAGFPHWARENQSLASALLSPSRPLPSDMIGVPVGVIFSRMPGVTLMVANLKMRLGDLAPAALAALGLGGRAAAREGR